MRFSKNKLAKNHVTQTTKIDEKLKFIAFSLTLSKNILPSLSEKILVA